MESYINITLLPDPEFPAPMLMNALFAKLHRVLVKIKSDGIGISFPSVNEKKPTLGDQLRLHGTAVALQNLQAQNWLQGMRDHLETSEIEQVPANAQHRQIKRVQVKSSAERLRRRYSKRHQGVTEQDAAELIPITVEKRLTQPYLQLKSESSGQSFRLFLQHQPPQAEAVAGAFNCYGISQTATIPWF